MIINKENVYGMVIFMGHKHINFLWRLMGYYFQVNNHYHYLPITIHMICMVTNGLSR